MTNSEKIRNMSDEELGEFLVKRIYTSDVGDEGLLCSDGKIFHDYPSNNAEIKAIKHELEWLKRECD